MAEKIPTDSLASLPSIYLSIEVLVTNFDLGLSFPRKTSMVGNRGEQEFRVGQKNTQTLGCWLDLLERFHASSGPLLGSDSTKRDFAVGGRNSPRLDAAGLNSFSSNYL